MEEELEFEVIRVRAKEGRRRRNALGGEGLEYSPVEKHQNEGKENSAPLLRDTTKSRLQRLGILYGDGEISSPIHRSEDKWVTEDDDDDAHASSDKYSEERSRRLAALANTINSWEDDIRHISPKKEEVEKFDRFGNKVGSKAIKHETVQVGLRNHNAPQTPSPTKKVAWDKKIINTLEMQGFKRCDSEEHLVYNYVSPSSSDCSSPRKTPGKKTFPKKEVENIVNDTNKTFLNKNVDAVPKSILQENSRNISPIKKQSPQKTAVREMAAQFDNKTSPSKGKTANARDPALLSVAEKRAVFEQNHGFVPIPQAPIVLAPPSVPRPTAPFQRDRSPPRKLFQPISPATPTGSSPVRHNVNQAVIDRFKEIEALRHRWDKNKILSQGNQNEEPKAPSPLVSKMCTSKKEISEIPPPPPMPLSTNTYTHSPSMSISPSPPSSPVKDLSPQNRIKMGTKSPVRKDSPKRRDPPKVLSVQEKLHKQEGQYPEVKRIKISPPKPGRLYPSISDIETESEVPESDLDPIEEEGSDVEYEERREETSFGCSTELESSIESGSSLGEKIVRQASKTNLKRPSQSLDNSSENESRILREMDDLLDEALGEPSPKRSRDSNDYEEKLSITPNFETCSSTSFEFSEQDKVNQLTNAEAKDKTPLMHTVSVYRKQQHMTMTPIRREVRRDEDYNITVKEPECDMSLSEEELVKEKIKELQVEVQKQLETISQASKALNLCLSTPGFTGTSAEIEAQKLLLIANARWNAMSQEIERLKIEKKLKPGLVGERVERGDITLSSISLPVKAFQSSDTNMSVICLVRSGSVVLHSEVLSIDRKTIRGGKLSFQKVINLKGLYSDFTASLEVYGYSSRNIDMPDRDSKSKSSTIKKDKNRMTPKKNKDKGFLPIESPAGPNAVRTSAFQLWGFAVFSLREVSRKTFTLNKVPYSCPLDGTLEVLMSSSMESQVEYSGFLTVYEDVSGFGAWKRRWAVLKGSGVAFWAYPDQCKEGKVAMDTIDLASVVTNEAGLAPRELCARPHTVLLESHIKDVSIPESLVVRRQGNVTVITHLLSADTKEERLQWCEKLNKVLHLLRAWKVSRNT